jgi:penicillin amidase
VSLDALARMLLALSVIEAQAVLRSITISCNWVVADRDGNIGYQQSGVLPNRAHSGLHPVPAAEEANRWRGRVDPARLLSTFNPVEGFLATANNELNPTGGPLAVNLPMGSYRHDRICAVLSANDRVTIDDMQRLQNDLNSLQADRFMSLLEPLLPELPAAELLRRWDRRYDCDSRGATVFEQVTRTARLRLRRRAVRARGLAHDRGVNHDPWPTSSTSSTMRSSAATAVVRRRGARCGARQVLERTLAHRRRRSAVGLDPPGHDDRHVLRRQAAALAHFDHGPIELAGNRATVVRAGFSPPTAGTPPSPVVRMVTDLGRDEAYTVALAAPTGSRFSPPPPDRCRALARGRVQGAEAVAERIQGTGSRIWGPHPASRPRPMKSGLGLGG